MEVMDYQKKHVARRLSDLALNMRSIAYALEAIGEEEKAGELRGAADMAEQWAQEVVNESDH